MKTTVPCPTCGHPTEVEVKPQIDPLVERFVTEQAVFEPATSTPAFRLLPAFDAWMLMNGHTPPRLTDRVRRDQLVTTLVIRGAHYNHETGHLEGVQL
jgi:hypothetical protein